MPQLIACPQCQKRLNIPDNAAGRKIKCPGCSHVFTAPAAGATPPATASGPAASPERPSQLKGPATPARPSQVRPPERPSQVKAPPPPRGTGPYERLSELKLGEKPAGAPEGNDLNDIKSQPAAQSLKPANRQLGLRIVVFLLCTLGAGSSGLLATIWLDSVKKQQAEMTPETEMLLRAMGQGHVYDEAIGKVNRLALLSYLLVAAGVLGIVCGVRAFKGKGLLPGMVLLAAIGGPILIYATLLADKAQAQPLLNLFFAPLVLAGLLALMLRERTPPVGKKHLAIDIPLGLAGLAVLGVAVYVQFFPINALPGNSFAQGQPSNVPPLDILLNDERSSIPQRGQEELRGSGVDKPEDDVQQLAQALIDLDPAAYRKWLESDPRATDDFERMVRFEGSAGKREPDVAARIILNDMVRQELLRGHACRTPVIPDGAGYANILIVFHHQNDAKYRKLAYKEKDGRWFRIGEAKGDLDKLQPAPTLKGSELVDLFPPTAALKPVEAAIYLSRAEKKPPTTVDEAVALIKEKYPKCEINDKKQLVTFNDQYAFLIDPALSKAAYLLLSPACQETRLRLSADFADDADLERLAKVVALEKLYLSGEQSRFTEKGLAKLKPLVNLQELHIDAPLATDAWLSSLQGMTRLKELELRSRVTDAGLAPLAGLTSLENVDLKGNYIKGPGLAHLQGLSKLANLNLANNHLSGPGLEHLAKCELAGLYLEGNFIDDDGMQPLTGLTSLQSLNLDSNLVGDAGLANLAGMTQLRDLHLAGNRITGPGLRVLQKLGKDGIGFTGQVTLERNPLNDAGVAVVADLKRAGARVSLDEKTLARVQAHMSQDPHLGDVLCLTFTPDGNTLISGGREGAVKFWDVAARKVRSSVYANENNAINNLALSSDGVVVAASDLRIWNVHTGRELHHKYVSGNNPHYAFLPGDRSVLIGSNSYNDEHIGLQVWDLGAEGDPRKLTVTKCRITGLALSKDGKWLATTSAVKDTEKNIFIWDMAKPEKPSQVLTSLDQVECLVMTPAGQVISGGRDRAIRVWDLASGKTTTTFETHGETVTALAISADGRLLASGSDDKTVRLWDLASGKELATITDLPIPIRAVALSPDGKTLAAGGTANTGYNKPTAKVTMKIWNVDEAIKAFPAGKVNTSPLAALQRLKAQVKYDEDDPKMIVEVSIYEDRVYDKDLAALAGLKELRKLRISSRAITDAGLAHLAGLTELEKLELGSSYGEHLKITDAGLKQLAGLTNLNDLALRGAAINGSGLAAFKEARGLRTLDLANSTVTDDGLAVLKDLPSLETLNLYNTPIKGTCLAALAGSKIKSINLGGNKTFDDNALQNLAKLTSLEWLDLDNTAITDAGLMQLKELTKLAQLSVDRTKVTPDGLRKLRGIQAAGNPLLYINSLGGGALVDERQPGKPVVSVAFNDKFAPADLDLLAKFPKLQRLELNGLQITDADLARLKGLSALRELTITFIPIDGSGLAHLKGNAGLRELLLYATALNDDGAKNIAAFKALESLKIGGESKLTDAGLAELKGLNMLVRLDLSVPAMKGPGLACLQGMTMLENLTLHCDKLDDAALAHVKGLEHLEDLNLGLCGVGDAALAHLAGLPALRSLSLFGDPVTSAGLAHLAKLKLNSLTLDGTKVDDAGLAHLKNMTSLTYLDLEETQVTSAGLEHLKGLVRLSSIGIAKTKITPEALKAFKEAQAANDPFTPIRKLGGFASSSIEGGPLDTISMIGAKFTDEHLALLKKFPQLKALDLTDAAITDAGLAHLATLTNLERLELGGTKIGPAGLAHLKGLTNLKELFLDDTPMDDAVFVTLRLFTKLTNLRLDGTGVTDKGILELKSSSGLRRLDLLETKVTAEGAKALQAALPKLQIER